MDSFLAIPTAELAAKSLLFASLVLLLLHVLKGKGSGPRQILCLAGSFLLFLLPFGELLPRYETEAFQDIFPNLSGSGAEAPPGAASSTFPAPLSLIWITGTAFLILRLGLGMIVLRNRRKQGLSHATRLADRCARRIGLKKPPAVLLSASVHSPVVAGVLKPTIFLPAEAIDWPTERLRLVFLHEMAHIKRGDLWTQLPGLFACALYWFNPLVWILHRTLCREREFACDSLVVHRGASAEEYAEHLVDIAAGRHQPLAAIPMSGDPSQLESRVVELLSGCGPKKGEFIPGGVLAITLLFSSILALGAATITGKKSGEVQSAEVIQVGMNQPGLAAGTATQPGKDESVWTQEEIDRRLRAQPFPLDER